MTAARADIGTGIELEDLAKAYGTVQAVRDLYHHDRAGRDRGPARAERGREVDHHRHAPRLDPARSWPCVAVRSDPEDAIDVGIDRGDAADRQPDPRPQRARADRHDGVAVPGPARRRRGARPHRNPGRSPIGAPRSCRAVRPSGCASPSPWCRTRSCSCSTSPRSPSTWRAVTTSGPRCGPTRRAAGPSCSPPTTSRRPMPTPTASCLMAKGRVVADGPATEIKARVGVRTIRATLPASDLDRAAGDRRGGDGRASRRGDGAHLQGLRHRAAHAAGAVPDARDIEVRGAGLEEAFLELTGEDDATSARMTHRPPPPTPASRCCGPSATPASSSSPSSSRSCSTCWWPARTVTPSWPASPSRSTT